LIFSVISDYPLKLLPWFNNKKRHTKKKYTKKKYTKKIHKKKYTKNAQKEQIVQTVEPPFTRKRVQLKIQGLYDPKNKQDLCGVGLVANIKGLFFFLILF
jgi:hypothetical protein